MKILQICKKFPYPLKDGESVAVTSLSKALFQLGCEVTLLTLNTTKHYLDVATLPTDFNHYKAIHTIDIDNRVKPLGALKALLQNKNYFLTRFESTAFKEKLDDLLKEQFDVIHFETLQTCIYLSEDLKKYNTPLISLRSHNIEHEIWERILQNTSNPLKKVYLTHLTKGLKTFELQKIQEIDTLVAITHRDLAQFETLGFRGNGQVTPIGLDAKRYQSDLTVYQEHDKPLSISFIGSLDWMPNLEGIEWFLEKVMPTLTERFPALTLHIAGRNTPNSFIQKNYKNVIIHGEVENAHDFINTHHIMIVPLFSGSGMRVKILEGMALSRVILTTTIGVEGIEAKHNEHLYIVNTVEEFLQQIEHCIVNQKKLIEIGKKARQFIEEKYDNLTIAKRLKIHYEDLIIKK